MDARTVSDRVDYALSPSATKLARVEAFQMAAAIYETRADCALVRMWPYMVNEDPALAVDMLIDAWFKHEVIVEDFLAPFLATTHHPERLRQLLAVLAYETGETLAMAVECAGNHIGYSPDELPSYRRKIQGEYAHIGGHLKRFAALAYRSTEVYDFAAGVDQLIGQAASVGALTQRQAALCARDFRAIAEPPFPPASPIARSRFRTPAVE